jgi:rare lipoprotein A
MTAMSAAGRGATRFNTAQRAFLTATALLASVAVLSGCGSSGSTRGGKVLASASNQKTSGKEYFAESTYGVKASPRVVSSSYDTTDKPVMLVPVPKPIGASDWSGGQAYALTPPAKKLRRGGGRDQIGKPYRVRGKWYTPADQPGYSRTGKASWYGDAFHGRLTANGEIYDMNHLTAAHPTLPLPSYARVTNVENGHSVIVRINDRGPYAHGRVIDLSKRAAHVLGTKAQGVGQVKVDYIGRAPVHGEDDRFLLASFRPSGKGNIGEDMRMYAAFTGRSAPAFTIASAPVAPVAVAPTPVAVQPVAVQPVAAFAAEPLAIQPVAASAFVTPGERPFEQALPSGGVVPVTRPDALVPLGYAADAPGRRDPFSAVLQPSSGLVAAMERLRDGGASAAPVHIHVMELAPGDDAGAITASLAPLGRALIADDGGARSVMLEVPQEKADNALKAMWAAGHLGAFALR